MACVTRPYLSVFEAAFRNARGIIRCPYTTTTTALRTSGQHNAEKKLQKSVTSEEAVNGLETETGDVFVDGKIKRKKTLRRELELMGLSKNADPSQASTVAARIRKQLQEKAGRQGAGVEEQEVEQSKKKTGNLRHQTRDLNKLDASVVARILGDSIIYDEGDIVALDKPYGLSVHGGPGVRHSIDSLLPQLAHRLNKSGNTPELHMIHRLDKETTGVMLLARTEMTARILHDLFKKREMIKKYLVITVGIPSPQEGILDMPMIEKEVCGKHRMVIKPDIGDVYPESRGMRSGGRSRDSHTAITKYRVLSQYGNCALVQLEPNTGVKHQIRVHLAQGLGCPILGDHKYSHHNKLAPQRLPDGTLRSLGITQPKARTVPMHLHAQQLIIPETFDRRTIFLSTRVPWHFSHNMKRLRLKYEP